ncbi:MAG: ATP-binding cassette domain-containing protein [Ardenticatenales bacterium]|nr:ATP-binding cassette domain-containing protein [Ardenticatenales bacterium]
MTDIIAEINGITFGYAADRPPIFDGFSWQVGAGERWAIIGPSGCGKSTLLYLLAGLRQPNVGQIAVEGVPVTRPRARIGLILQSHGLLPWATVWDNVTLGPRIGRFYRYKQTGDDPAAPYPPAAIPPERSQAWLARLGIDALAQSYPAQLSGGQRQRVAIARTLVLDPILLLMDEPFSALDVPTREDLQRQVRQLTAERQLTTILVTHDVEEAAFMAEKILVLHQPPNRAGTIIANPRMAAADFRRSAAYSAVTATLRAALERSPTMAHEAAP